MWILIFLLHSPLLKIMSLLCLLIDLFHTISQPYIFLYKINLLVLCPFHWLIVGSERCQHSQRGYLCYYLPCTGCALHQSTRHKKPVGSANCAFVWVPPTEGRHVFFLFILKCSMDLWSSGKWNLLHDVKRSDLYQHCEYPFLNAKHHKTNYKGFFCGS